MSVFDTADLEYLGCRCRCDPDSDREWGTSSEYSFFTLEDRLRRCGLEEIIPVFQEEDTEQPNPVSTEERVERDPCSSIPAEEQEPCSATLAEEQCSGETSEEEWRGGSWESDGPSYGLPSSPSDSDAANKPSLAELLDLSAEDSSESEYQAKEAKETEDYFRYTGTVKEAVANVTKTMSHLSSGDATRVIEIYQANARAERFREDMPHIPLEEIRLHGSNGLTRTKTAYIKFCRLKRWIRIRDWIYIEHDGSSRGKLRRRIELDDEINDFEIDVNDDEESWKENHFVDEAHERMSTRWLTYLARIVSVLDPDGTCFIPSSAHDTHSFWETRGAYH